MTVVPLSRDLSKFSVGTCSYNGINFPPVKKCKGTYEPVYDDSGRITKYIKGTLSVDCYLFPGCFEGKYYEGQDIIRRNYNIAPAVQSTVDATSNKDYTTDTTLQYVRQYLVEPCQHLKIQYQGFGHIDLNGTEAGSIRDVNNGPKPKLVRWTPLTNKMAHVEWEVEFCYSPCQMISTSSGKQGHNICQWPFTVSLEVGANGLSTRTISGRVEYRRTRIPSIGHIDEALPDTSFNTAGISENFSMNTMVRKVISVFPRMAQFKRTKESFVLSNDRKYLEFNIVDEEINSEDAYGEGIAQADVRIITSSNFDAGYFNRWATTLEGTIHLQPGYSKSWAWSEIVRLFTRYCGTCNQGRPPKNIKLTDVDGTPNKTASSLKSSWAIMRQIKFTDNIFDRSVNFSYSWDLFVEPEDIFAVTGMFLPIEYAHSNRVASWNKWRVGARYVYDYGGWQQLEFAQDKDIVVSLCNPWSGPIPDLNKQYPADPIKQFKDPTTGAKPKRDNKKDMRANNSVLEQGLYSNYLCAFGMSIGTSTFTHITLFSLPALSETAPDFNLKNSTKPTQLPPEPTKYDLGGQPIDWGKPISHRIRPQTQILTMQGFAERLGYPPQIPTVESVCGLPVTPIGVTRIEKHPGSSGVNIADGNDYSIHRMSWIKQYMVQGTGSGNFGIKSTGHSGGYIT